MLVVPLVLAALGALIWLRVAWRRKWFRSGIGRLFVWAGSVVSIVVLSFTALAVAGVVVDDAIDDLAVSEQARIRSGVRRGFGCENEFGLARVSKVEVTNNGNNIRWTCSWTLLGWPHFDGRSDCVGGAWQTKGWLTFRGGGSC